MAHRGKKRALSPDGVCPKRVAVPSGSLSPFRLTTTIQRAVTSTSTSAGVSASSSSFDALSTVFARVLDDHPLTKREEEVSRRPKVPPVGVCPSVIEATAHRIQQATSCTTDAVIATCGVAEGVLRAVSNEQLRHPPACLVRLLRHLFHLVSWHDGWVVLAAVQAIFAVADADHERLRVVLGLLPGFASVLCKMLCSAAFDQNPLRVGRLVQFVHSMCEAGVHFSEPTIGVVLASTADTIASATSVADFDAATKLLGLVSCPGLGASPFRLRRAVSKDARFVACVTGGAGTRLSVGEGEDMASPPHVVAFVEACLGLLEFLVTEPAGLRDATLGAIAGAVTTQLTLGHTACGGVVAALRVATTAFRDVRAAGVLSTWRHGALVRAIAGRVNECVDVQLVSPRREVGDTLAAAVACAYMSVRTLATTASGPSPGWAIVRDSPFVTVVSRACAVLPVFVLRTAACMLEKLLDRSVASDVDDLLTRLCDSSGAMTGLVRALRLLVADAATERFSVAFVVDTIMVWGSDTDRAALVRAGVVDVAVDMCSQFTVADKTRGLNLLQNCGQPQGVMDACVDVLATLFPEAGLDGGIMPPKAVLASAKWQDAVSTGLLAVRLMHDAMKRVPDTLTRYGGRGDVTALSSKAAVALAVLALTAPHNRAVTRVMRAFFGDGDFWRRAIAGMETTTLPVERRSEDGASTTPVPCAVCLEAGPLASGGGPHQGHGVRLPCLHVFHATCVCAWFVTCSRLGGTVLKATCPVCRACPLVGLSAMAHPYCLPHQSTSVG
jgi:hypothetical protein